MVKFNDDRNIDDADTADDDRNADIDGRIDDDSNIDDGSKGTVRKKGRDPSTHSTTKIHGLETANEAGPDLSQYFGSKIRQYS